MDTAPTTSAQGRTMSPSEGPSKEALAYDLLRRLYPHLCHIQRYLDNKLWLSDDIAKTQWQLYILTRTVYWFLKDEEATHAQEESNL